MNAGEFVHDTRVRVATLVFACFLLGSTGWFSWLNVVIEQTSAMQVDFHTMVMGYLSQVLGLGLFMAACAHARDRKLRALVIVSLVAYVVLLDPATMTQTLATTLGFGWAMNICIGFAQGYYLLCLAGCVEKGRRGTVFGSAYAASTLASWLISSIGGGVLASGLACLGVCAVLAAMCIALVLVMQKPLDTASIDFQAQKKSPSPKQSESALPGGILALACVTIVLVSLVKNAGFSFPAEDLSGVVNLELSRLFYGIGLLVAGIVADRERSYVMLLCAVSLVVPFLMLALSGAGASGIIIWAIGYLLFGFFTVFRILLFADFAAQDGRLWISAAGLLFGRIGDVLGTIICLSLGGSPITLVLVTTVLFAISAWLLFMLYKRIFVLGAEEGSQTNTLGEFSADYGLSVREREILPLLVEGKTYAEIADELYVTESTVKFHSRNIREKTGCSTRIEVADLYCKFSDEK